MSVKLLTEHQLEFLSLLGGCTGSSESTLVKMPHCWKSHVVAQMYRLTGHLICYKLSYEVTEYSKIRLLLGLFGSSLILVYTLNEWIISQFLQSLQHLSNFFVSIE